MIKKYWVDQHSSFNESIILPLFERGELAFHIETLSESKRKDLFPSNAKIKTIKNDADLSSVPSNCVAAYLDEEENLKALILLSSSKTYYLFKVDSQKDRKLNINQKYISKDLDALMDDYEKHLKNKGKKLYAGEADTSIDDISYFENKYKDEEKKHHDKESTIYRLTFKSNNVFTTDFVYRVESKKITILNKEYIDKSALTLLSIEKNRNDRNDCLLIDSKTKDITFFIFTYKPHYTKHYLLFKNVGNDTFEFIKETICFNEIFTLDALKDVTYKNGSEFSAKSFAKNKYENFSEEYIEFEEEEEFDEAIQEELIVVDEAKIRKDLLLEKVFSMLNSVKNKEDIGVTYHGKERILERIGEMSNEEMRALAKVAYHIGLTSAHFIEKDPLMFEFLSYKQGKKIGKTARVYEDILFYYSLEAPHDLVTCFFYKNNLEIFRQERSKSKKKKK